MPSFASAREAKEYLVAQIVAQAARDEVVLSPTETELLYFTETAWMPPGTAEASSHFNQNDDAATYEKKVSCLATHARTYARQHGTRGPWDEAVSALAHEDHYLLLLLPPAQSRASDRIKLVLAALLITALIALLISLMAVRA